jgi:hypothetical protein
MGGSESKEGSYKRQLYFDSDAGQTNSSYYWINDEDLLSKMSQLANVNEAILNVTICRHPLNDGQV